MIAKQFQTKKKQQKKPVKQIKSMTIKDLQKDLTYQGQELKIRAFSLFGDNNEAL